jgi:hypothetical protein
MEGRIYKLPAITYQNTATNIPGWVNTVHVDQPRGYAYEQDGRFFHVYGRARNLWVLSTGLTTSELVANETLDDWTARVFGSTNRQTTTNEPGNVVSCVWRPGLYFIKEIHQALSTNEHAQRSAEQALRILIEKLDDILLYIEPTTTGLKAYGHKTRELLILCCTEVENYWRQYIQLANPAMAGRACTTNDYVKLLQPLHLSEFKIRFKLISNNYSSSPFQGWSAASPTQSLPWYDSYNKTKHNRDQHFSEATLENCLHAISAAITMFCVRHSPFPLIEGSSSLSGLFTQHFDVELDNPDPRTFYIPKFDTPDNIRADLFCGKMTDHVTPWVQQALII